ncbi:phosphoribosyltransferase family protein [Desertivirga brevis]|uniref:phosphoribosyltransferase family protein n=1 Tax=Desertivirga brevis TaxID=2810310 RepID=UPI001A95D5B1|nr:phosphoribosyltransferase family protein [Pedobacter sp. SYSU D00873]
MRKTYSLHKISDPSGFMFNPDEYSRFKFGDGAVAKKFGTSLAKGFIKEVLAFTPIHRQIVVFSSPYAFVPTATFAMKTHFVYELNHWLAENNYPVIQEAKVYRTITYKEDYGNLDAKQRLALIENDSFHIDRSFLENKLLIFLDDIRITGSHERMIDRMIKSNYLDNDVFLVYFAQLTNEGIHPTIENSLNYHCVKSIFDLNGIINSGEFQINTRIVKYILSSDPETFGIFIKDQNDAFIENLYNMAIGNGYHRIENYSVNLKYIKQNLIINKANLIVNGN